MTQLARALVALLCAIALWMWVNRDRVSDASPRFNRILTPRR